MFVFVHSEFSTTSRSKLISFLLQILFMLHAFGYLDGEFTRFELEILRLLKGTGFNGIRRVGMLLHVVTLELETSTLHVVSVKQLVAI